MSGVIGSNLDLFETLRSFSMTFTAAAKFRHLTTNK